MNNEHSLKSHILSSLKFVFIFYFIDSTPLYYTFSQSNAFNGVVTDSIFLHHNIFINFLFGLVALLLTLSMAIGALTYIFKVRNKFIFYTLVCLYCYIYNLIEQPSIYDDFIHLNYYIQFLNGLANYFWVYLISFLITALLNLNFFLYQNKNNRDIFGVLMANLLLVSFFIFAQQPLNNTKPINKHAKLNFNHDQSSRYNVILLGIDSLRHDSFSNLEQRSYLKKILDRSITFRSSISPVANTRPAYNAILSGKAPPEIKERFPLKRLDEDKKYDFEKSPLLLFKKQNYTTHYMLDDASFNKPEKGVLFDSVDSPPNTMDLRKYIYPILLRSRIIFTFFNNSLGNHIFPGIYGNFAYTYAYKVSGFTNKVKTKINQLKDANKPFLLMVHSSALHFPGNFRYPYYIKGGPKSHNLLGFGSRAPYLNAISDSLPIPGQETARFYPLLYKKGIDMVQNHLIDPIIQHLIEKDLAKNTIFVLFSDHGETFWNKNEIPRLKLPNHGTFLLGEDDSPKTFLSIYIPQQKSTRVKYDFPLMTLLQEIYNFAVLNQSPTNASFTTQKTIYTETGMFPLKLYEDQFFFSEFKFSELFSINAKGKVFLSKKAVLPTLIQKTRVVYSYPYRLTLYLANDGYRLFLCNFSEDKTCLVNLVYSKPKVLNGLFSQLMKKVKPDIEKGYLPQLKIDTKDPLYAMMSRDPINDHLSLIFAISHINRNLATNKPIMLLDSLINNTNSPTYVREKAFSYLKKTCDLWILPNSRTAENSILSSVCKKIQPPLSSAEVGFQANNKYKKNEKLLSQYRDTGDFNLYQQLNQRALSGNQKKLLEILFFFHMLNVKKITPDIVVQKILSYLNTNYRLAASLELREEFDLFWSEAFDFISKKFGKAGIYPLLLTLTLHYRISNHFFLQKLYPFIVENSIPRDLLLLRNASDNIDLKTIITSNFIYRSYCQQRTSQPECETLENKYNLHK